MLFKRLVKHLLLGALMWGNVSYADTSDTYIAEFDWLVQTNGLDEFLEPLLTLNQEDLKRFEPTGNLTGVFRIGEIEVEVRGAVIFSTEEYPDQFLDQPASVVIKNGNKILVGAKGYSFETDVAEHYIKVEHWNGEIGCSIARWYLEVVIDDENSKNSLVRVVESEYVDLIERKQCQPESS